MAYVDIPTLDITSGRGAKASTMQQFKANDEALRDGSGILDNAIVNRHLSLSSIIGQTEIKTAIQSADVAQTPISAPTVFSSSVTSPTYTIGYSYATTGYNSGGTSYKITAGFGGEKNASDADWATQSNIFTVTLDAGATQTFGADVDIRYFTASPPYDLGDGEIPLFVWLCLDKDKKIVRVNSDITPPWAYNGPTRTEPDYYKGKKGFYRRKRIDPETGKIISEEVEISSSIKNADMEIIPHPFILKPDEKVLLLDPVSTLELSEYREAGIRTSELLFNDYLRLDNEKINRKTPTGITPVKFKWKNTKSRAGEMIKDKKARRPR